MNSNHPPSFYSICQDLILCITNNIKNNNNKPDTPLVLVKRFSGSLI